MVTRWIHNSRGEWYVVVQIALIFAIIFAAWQDGHALVWTKASTLLGGTLFLIGMIVSTLGVAALGRNLSPFPKPLNDSRLVKRGIYSIVRHPIYCGIIFLVFGWSLVRGSLLAIILSAILFVFFDFKARREERWLEEKFAGYTVYKMRVKKLIPFIY